MLLKAFNILLVNEPENAKKKLEMDSRCLNILYVFCLYFYSTGRTNGSNGWPKRHKHNSHKPHHLYDRYNSGRHDELR